MSWASQVNQQYGGDGESLAVFDLVITFLESLGWVVVMSGDGLMLYSAVGNVLTNGATPPPIVGSIGNNLAWFVIESPSGVQVLFQRGGAGTQTYRWLLAVSHSGAFSGGSAAVRATAPDEHGIPSDPPAVSLNSFGADSGGNSYYHMIAADEEVNGQWPFELLKTHVTTGVTLGHFVCWAVEDEDPGDTAPLIWSNYGEALASGWLNTGRRARTLHDPAGAATWETAYAEQANLNGVAALPGVTGACPDGLPRTKRIDWWTKPGGVWTWKGRSTDMVWCPDTSDATPWNHLWEDQYGGVHVALEAGTVDGVLIPGWPALTTCPLPDLGGGIETAEMLIVETVASPDIVPPTIAVVSPVVGSTIRASDPFVVDVSDDEGGLGLVVLTVELPSGGDHEVVWLRDAFAAGYSAGSQRSAITGGYRYTIRRSGGWSASPTFHVEAIDMSGNLGA